MADDTPTGDGTSSALAARTRALIEESRQLLERLERCLARQSAVHDDVPGDAGVAQAEQA